MQALFNANADVAHPPRPSRVPLEFHRRLPGYERTPLRLAPTLARELDLEAVWVKVESRRLDIPSFKILGASWGVYRALERHTGGLPPWNDIDALRMALDPYRPLDLAAATDGNHGRAVARMARLLGMGARVFVPTGTAAARVADIVGEGASCDVVQGTYGDAVKRSAQEQGDDCLVISDTSWPGYVDVPSWVIEGYSTMFWEIEEQLVELAEDVPRVVMVQIGVGALGAAAVRHFRSLDNRDTIMIGVEPQTSACVLASVEAGKMVTINGPHDSIMVGLNCDTPSMVAWSDVSAGFHLLTAIGDDSARLAMRLLAQDGIVAGETGAAGAAGLIELCANEPLRVAACLGAGSRVLTLCTEGATDPQAYEEIVGSSPSGVAERAEQRRW